MKRRQELMEQQLKDPNIRQSIFVGSLDKALIILQADTTHLTRTDTAHR